jgi:hydrogenase expression/formation protein HypD
MEVCGGQTHSLLRSGIDAELQDIVELIHGPGCPVCVTPAEAIELAQTLSIREATVLMTFGDMMRVPGSRETLLDRRAAGGNIRSVYSPIEAVHFAQRHPEFEVVFFAVGFETTAPTTALAVRQAAALKLNNFSVLVAHVRVLPAMKLIVGAVDNRVQGFLAAGHVCTVTGWSDYHAFVEQFEVPVAVTGFEPVDLLTGILQCVQQLESGHPAVVNCYSRTARPEGNQVALNLMWDVFEICDRPWRGIGVVPEGGLQLRREWRSFDALARFGQGSSSSEDCTGCRSGDVMSGRIRPPECPHFGSACTPDRPLGAPMVSSEGTCAAYFRYGHLVAISPSGK